MKKQIYALTTIIVMTFNNLTAQTIDINTLCSEIQIKTDDFTNEVKINSPT